MRELGIRVLSVALLAFLAGCRKDPADTDTQGDPSSSQDVAEIRTLAEKYQSTLSKQDWATFLSCMDQESQFMYVGMAMSMARFHAVNDESKKKSLDELLRRHGIEQPPKGGTRIKLPLRGFDKAALMGDIAAWSEKTGGSPVKGADEAEFSDFKVDGDSATATSTSGTGTQSKMYFKRVEGKWYIDLSTTMRKGMENLKRPPSRKGP